MSRVDRLICHVLPKAFLLALVADGRLVELQVARRDRPSRVESLFLGRLERVMPELDAAFAQINQELRAQYLIAYTPSNRGRDGTFRQIKIEVVNPALRKAKLRLLYRQGYYARNAPANTNPPAKK